MHRFRVLRLKSAALVMASLVVSGVASADPGPFSPPAKGTALTFIAEAAESMTLPLNMQKPIFSLAISGDAWLSDSASLVRVILTDKDGNDYLVYEGYPLLAGGRQGRFALQSHCEETCALAGITPASLRIQVERAKVRIKSLSVAFSEAALPEMVKAKGLRAFAGGLKEKQHGAKVAKIKSAIDLLKLTWSAGRTSVSVMSYADKERLFRGEVPNLQGFEYYTGGYFTFDGSSAEQPRLAVMAATSLTPPPVPTKDLVPYPTPVTITTAPQQWDWRSAHGENWMTPVRDQGYCGSCWDFAAVGAIEADTNLYFNQHLDFNLSEQDVLSCSGGGTCAGGSPYTAVNYGKSGLVDESCMPYRAIDASGCDAGRCGYTPVLCSSKCATAAVKVSTGGGATLSSDENTMKMGIVKGGAVAGIVSSWSHAMAIAGYGVVKAGDQIYDVSAGVYSSPRVVPAGEPTIGKTYWIFKNSWGTGWGESGYGKLVFTSAGPSAAAVSLPVTVQGTVVTPACTDKDGDGYCNWGIGPKPASCPVTCKAEEDCDDSNAAIGACTFTQTTQAFVHVCREYLSSATYCPSSGQSCPAGYRAIASTTGCASTGKGKSKTIYWNYCARDFNSCGTCPAGTVLVANQACGVGQVCSATTNQCG